MAVTKEYVSTRKRVKAAAVAKDAPAKRGRPAGSKNKPKTDKPVDWEALAKKLQRALAKQIKDNERMEWQVSVYRQTIESQLQQFDELENRSWLSRLFNLKG
jgi:hypothetical protein